MGIQIRYPRVYNPDTPATPVVRVFSYSDTGHKPIAPAPPVPSKVRPPWQPDPPPVPCVLCAHGTGCLIHRSPKLELRCSFGGTTERTPVNEYVEYHLLRADLRTTLRAWSLWPCLISREEASNG